MYRFLAALVLCGAMCLMSPSSAEAHGGCGYGGGGFSYGGFGGGGYGYYPRAGGFYGPSFYGPRYGYGGYRGGYYGGGRGFRGGGSFISIGFGF